jgi:hypothetical protein
MQKYRYHGVTYPPNKNQGTDFLKESVTLKKHGIFPIFYEVLTGQNWQFENKIIAMSEIYPFIINVSHEYVQAYSMPVGFQGVNIWIDNISGNKYQLFGLLHESPHLNSGKLRCLKIFRGVKNSKNTKNRIEGDIVSASSREEAEVKLEKNIFRFLLYYSRDSSGNFTTYTPISGSNFLLPEEIPIWLAFFHLSNVVRYNPEAMEKITTSKAWPILLTLRHHSLHKYLQLFWSNFHQKNYMLVVG